MIRFKPYGTPGRDLDMQARGDECVAHERGDRSIAILQTEFGSLSGKDERGEWHVYACEYHHDGAWWALNLLAYGIEDAEARLQKMPRARILGTVGAVIPAFPGGSPILSLFCSVLNGIRRLFGQRGSNGG